MSRRLPIERGRAAPLDGTLEQPDPRPSCAGWSLLTILLWLSVATGALWGICGRLTGCAAS